MLTVFKTILAVSAHKFINLNYNMMCVKVILHGINSMHWPI